MILVSCCHSAVLLLWFGPCWVALPNRLVTSEWAQPKAFSDKKRKRQPPPVWGRPTPTTTSSPLWGDVSAPSWKPPGLQGPVIYRSYLHMAKALRDIRQAGCFFFACHFTLPMQSVLYSYCSDPAMFCIWHPRHDLSVFDTSRLFFLCKCFVYTALLFSDVVRFLIPRIWVMSRGYGYRWRHDARRQREKGRKAKGGREGETERWQERRIEAALLEARHRLRLTSLSLTDWWDYPDIFSF